MFYVACNDISVINITAQMCRLWFGLVYLLFNVTINDILVTYVTAHRCAGGQKKLDLRSGSQRHRHFVGFFNGPPFLYGDSDTPPHLVAFYDHAGDTEDTFST